MNKRPVIFDTDPGVDDFFAWMLLNASDQFDIKAVITVPGNQTLEAVTRNAKGIYKLFNMHGVRLAQGSPRHMIKALDIHSGHGPTGLGNITLDTTGVELDEYRAWDVIYQEAVKAGGELELIAVGPLTNLGIAFFKYPDLKGMIKQITVMGGTTEEGNMSPFGEANIYHDPHAAKIVFDTGIPIVMVGLNALAPCAMTKEDMLKLMPECLDSDVRAVCTDLVEFRGGYPFCDAVTVAAIMDDRFAEWAEYGVEIETRSPLTWGATICDKNGSYRYFGDGDERPKVKVAITSDRVLFFEMFREMFTHYCG